MNDFSGICKVAFVGAGYMSSEHIKAFRSVRGVELAGIYSRTFSRAQKLAQEFGINSVFSTIEEMFDKTTADLVVVSVPELSVRGVCSEVLRFPWTSLIEKPVGYEPGEAQAILEMAEGQCRRAYVALNRRHYSSTRRVVEDLSHAQGQRLIHVFDQEDLITARKSGQPDLVVRNWMYANSIHLIDYLTFLGRGRIEAVVPIVPWNCDDPRFVSARISFESGDIGIYEAVWNGPGPWAVTVTTQEKRWEMRPLEQCAFQIFGSRKLVPVPIDECDSIFKPGLRFQASEAIKAAMGIPHSLPDLAAAMHSMNLVKAIYAGSVAYV
jgi:predicted dehydrogenase